MRRPGLAIIIVTGILIAAGAGLWLSLARGAKPPSFKVVRVKRGNLVATIGATGTLEPDAAVDVGAQVQGVIVAFGKDRHGQEINWGSKVEAGMVLARIDDSLYRAAVGTAKAQLAQAEATLTANQANVLQQKANLLLASQNWQRAQQLGPSDALAQSAYDQYQSAFEVAKANLASAEAAVEQAKAAILAAKANLATAQLNLDYCTIKSPVKGVVIDRRVNIGQTVVSSLSAPSLFLIADDLKQIQVWVSVNEADVGRIHPDQPVTFTVDAYPGQVFQGKVGQVRLNATMTQNVVTYTIEVDTDNSDGRLLPYLTANALFQIGRREDVLLVPNEALRWTPKPEMVVRGARAPGHDHAARGGAEAPQAILWLAQGHQVRPLKVEPGLTDGSWTEVAGAGLREGVPVVTGESVLPSDSDSAAERNPFAPPRFPWQQRGGKGQEPSPAQGPEPEPAAPGANRKP